MKEIRDAILLDWIISGDNKRRDAAFEHIYKKYYPSVEGHVLRNQGTLEEVKDLFQDAVIVFYNQVLRGNFKRESSIKTYLFAICKNLWLKRLSKKKVKTDLENLNEQSDEQMGIDEMLIGNEEEQLIAQLVEQLGLSCQKLLTLFYYDKLSMKQIQKTLGLTSVQVAKNKKLKCMKKLREMVLQNPKYVRALKK